MEEDGDNCGANDAEIAEELGVPLSDVIEFRETFNLVDKDRGGSIDKEELSELLELLGIHKSPEELDEIMAEIDSTGEGEITFQDFTRVMAKKVDAKYTAKEVIEAFQKFADDDAPYGCIRLSTFEKVLCSFEGKMDLDEAQTLTSKIEVDKHGYVNFIEYVNINMPS